MGTAQLASKMRLCMECSHRITMKGDKAVCEKTGKALRFYDPSCEHFLAEEDARDFVWHPELKAYVLE